MTLPLLELLALVGVVTVMTGGEALAALEARLRRASDSQGEGAPGWR